MPYVCFCRKRLSSRVSDVLGEVVLDVGIEAGERANAMSFAVEGSEFEHTCVDELSGQLQLFRKVRGGGTSD